MVWIIFGIMVLLSMGGLIFFMCDYRRPVCDKCKDNLHTKRIDKKRLFCELHGIVNI